jgi:hypothetical protein
MHGATKSSNTTVCVTPKRSSPAFSIDERDYYNAKTMTSR